jgi:beta-fructofuranosidase
MLAPFVGYQRPASLPKTPNEVLRSKLASDRHRPQYHFLPPAYHMNDPHGAIYWKGQYHMFYQNHPDETFQSTTCWGHARSSDLVHWKHLPIALAPTPGGPDQNGCWSGCIVINKGTPTIFYTGVSPGVQAGDQEQTIGYNTCMATSDDEMIRWQKYSGNPVIASPPKGLKLLGFRDTNVWLEDDIWYMLIGSGFPKVGPTALLYRSKDLIRWEYMRPLYVGQLDPLKADTYRLMGGPQISGEMWEFPTFFPLGGKRVLLVSTMGINPYWVGTYADFEFRPETRGQCTFGTYYSANTQLDATGRRILWGYIRERRSREAQLAAGWSGVLSLPRVLSLTTDGSLRIEPAPQLQVLRSKRLFRRSSAVTPSDPALLEHVRGDCLEISAEFESGSAEECGLRVRCAPDLSEETLIVYNRRTRRLVIDTKKSSLYGNSCSWNDCPSEKVDAGSMPVGSMPMLQEAQLDLAERELLQLQVFLDGSVVEVFANKRVCITGRVYPSQIGSLHLGLLAIGGDVKLVSTQIWELQPISRDRLTS